MRPDRFNEVASWRAPAWRAAEIPSGVRAPRRGWKVDPEFVGRAVVPGPLIAGEADAEIIFQRFAKGHPVLAVAGLEGLPQSAKQPLAVGCQGRSEGLVRGRRCSRQQLGQGQV